MASGNFGGPTEMNSIDIFSAVRVKHTKQDHNGNAVQQIKRYPDHTKEEAAAIRMKFPTKIPIIIERYYKEIDLPLLDKRKFLAPQDLTMSQFCAIIRHRMRLSPNKAIFLLVNNRSMVSLSRTIAEIYAEHRGFDGFLHMTYASQEVFGCEIASAV